MHHALFIAVNKSLVTKSVYFNKNRDCYQITMSGDNGFCEEKQKKVMRIEDDVGREGSIIF